MNVILVQLTKQIIFLLEQKTITLVTFLNDALHRIYYYITMAKFYVIGFQDLTTTCDNWTEEPAYLSHCRASGSTALSSLIKPEGTPHT